MPSPPATPLPTLRRSPRTSARVPLTASLVVMLVALAASVALAAQPTHHHADAAPAHTHGGELAEGLVSVLDQDTPATFWVTPLVECTGEPSPDGISAPKSCVDGEAFHYTLEVAAPAAQLRVDWDQPFRQDDFTLTVTSPSGDEVSQASHNTYSEGVTIETPAAGVYDVTLDVIRTNHAKVRMRAGLVTPSTTDATELLPNLRVTPPFEFGFAAPISPLNPVFLAGDDQNPPMTIQGDNLASCASDEVVERADPTRNNVPKVLTRCLRLSTGPHNVGEGHFDLRFPIVDRAVADQDRLEEMTQIIHNADGTVTERAAGTYEYHVTHGHYHYLDILTYEAFLVDQETGELTRAGEGKKSGFCPADQGYGEWTTFDQGPNGAVGDVHDGDSCFAFSGNGAMGLSAGWGDFYRWQRSGQYIDFSDLGDGHYVIRATVDILDNVLETDETDNAGYAYLCITGDDIKVAERGYGMSPYDPAKSIATDNRAEIECEVAAAGKTTIPAPAPTPVPDTVAEAAADDTSAAEPASPTGALPATGAGGIAALLGTLGAGSALIGRRRTR